MDAAGLRHRNEARCQRILETCRPLVLDDLPWADVGDHVLAAPVLDTLLFMRDVEGFTDRDPVGLSAHRTTLTDPIVRRFLDMWRTEERSHTRALESFLARYLEARADDDGIVTGVPDRQPPPPSVAPLRERIVAQIGGEVGRMVAAAHMTWGAANELLTLNGYRLLAHRCGHPLLRELLTRIAAQESRHFSFYLLQAEWRLARSRTTRAALRAVLRGPWTPVGIGDGYKTPAEFATVFGYLTGGEDGAATIDRMDRRIAALPGFADLRIFRQAASTYAVA